MDGPLLIRVRATLRPGTAPREDTAMTPTLRFLAIVVLTAIALIVAPLRAPAQPPPPAYLAQWGTLGAGPGQFDVPEGIATDRAGLVYVADFLNLRVQKFSGGGDLVEVWPMPTLFPAGVMPDGNGHVYVLNASPGSVLKCDDHGVFLRQWAVAGPNGPTTAYGLAVDRDGYVYVAATGVNSIDKYDPNGTRLARWGGTGAGPGQLSQPYGLAVSADGIVYVADTGNARIQSFDLAGHWLGSWGTRGSGPGQFNNPWSVACGPDGLLYVTDSSNHRIQAFNRSGGFELQWGSYGSGNGQFRYPHGIATDFEGNLFVTDTGNNRVEKFGAPVTPALATTWGRVMRLYR